METTVSQPFVFLLMLYGGMLVGAAYDIYRCFRVLMKKGRWITALLDTLFIITLGLIVVYVMYAANLGELRLFTFIGFTIGFALYMAGISPFIVFICRKISSWNKKRKSG